MFSPLKGLLWSYIDGLSLEAPATRIKEPWCSNASSGLFTVFLNNTHVYSSHIDDLSYT